jgi:hypothetical protein
VFPTLGGLILGEFERYRLGEKSGYMSLESSIRDFVGGEGIDLEDIAIGSVHV